MTDTAFGGPASREAASRTRTLLATVEALRNGETQIRCIGLLTAKEYDHYLGYRMVLAPADALRRVLYPAGS